MNNHTLALMAGVDIPIPDLALTIHPLTIQEIALMGESEFFQAAQYLCIDKEALVQDKTLLQNLTNFQVLMKVLEQSKDKSKKIALNTLLLLLFPGYQVVITPRSIIFSKAEKEPIMVDESNFDILQEIVKEVLCMSSLFQGKNIVYNPADKRAKEIADKLMKARQKIAKQKAEQQQSQSVLTRYLSILTIGRKIPIQQLAQCNLFQLFDMMERYTAFIEWDIDLRVRLAGGKPEKKVDMWMNDLHSKK